MVSVLDAGSLPAALRCLGQEVLRTVSDVFLVSNVSLAATIGLFLFTLGFAKGGGAGLARTYHDDGGKASWCPLPLDFCRWATVIHNAAREPEIGDLADLLVKMGAKVQGAGSPVIEVEGVARLVGAKHRVLPDRIEAGTYAMAAAMTGGDVLLQGARAEHLQAALDILAEAGAHVDSMPDGLRVSRNGNGIKPVDVATAPFPGFPTDLQAQFMALMTRAEGVSRITETIFENRFMHVQELARFGARIKLEGDSAIVEGVPALKGAPVMATDLRASVSLVIAALAAEGESMIQRVYHLDRGFEALERKLSRCGADVTRISSGD